MADRRGGRVKRKQLKNELEKPSKEEYAVAKFLRFNAPSKEGKFLGNNAQYFIGSKAVDTLLNSKWATAKATKMGPLFTNRSSCINYCERLLEKGFFQRAARVEKKSKRIKGGVGEGRVEKSELRQRKGEGEKPTPTATAVEKDSISSKKPDKKKKEESPKAGEAEQEGDKIKGSPSAVDKSPKAAETKLGEGEKSKDEPAGEEKKKKKKKLKLEPHERQMFIDGTELYVWLYEPVQAKTFIIGLLLVLGAIAVCLFPLWPPEVRLGVYYLSLAAAGFVGLILSLCIVRMVIFSIAWVLTLGKVSFWFLPNLTEDVGFIDSFRPLYNCQYNTAVPPSAAEVKNSTETMDGKDDDKQADGHGNEEEEEVEDIGERGEEEDDDDVDNDKDDDDEEGRRSGGSSNSYEMVDVAEMDEDLPPIGQQGDQSESDEEVQKSEQKKTN